MPLYDYACARCGWTTELFRAMEARHDPAYCQHCEGPLGLQFSAPTALRTDTQFQRGIHFRDGCRSNRQRTRLAANARRMGVAIEGKRYDGRFAEFPDDPRACYGTVAEARALARKFGYASPDLGVAAPVDETSGRPYRVADHIVDRHVQQIVQQEHGGTVGPAKRQELAAEVRAKIEPPGGALR